MKLKSGFVPVALIVIISIILIGGGFYYLKNSQDSNIIADASRCEKMKNSEDKVSCYVMYAYQKRDTTICDTLREVSNADAVTQGECYLNIAAETKDRTICEKVGKDLRSALNESLYNLCINKFSGEKVVDESPTTIESEKYEFTKGQGEYKRDTQVTIEWNTIASTTDTISLKMIPTGLNSEDFDNFADRAGAQYTVAQNIKNTGSFTWIAGKDVNNAKIPSGKYEVSIYSGTSRATAQKGPALQITIK